MAKLFINALIFGVCLQLICYLMWAFNVFGGLLLYPFGDVSMLSTTFSINVYSALIGIGGGVAIGLAALLLKQGVYAVFAMLLWAIGCMFNVIQSFFLAIPNTIASFLPNSTNPLPAVDGVYPTNPLIIVLGVIFAFAAWMYLFGLVIQRDVT